MHQILLSCRTLGLTGISQKVVSLRRECLWLPVTVGIAPWGVWRTLALLCRFFPLGPLSRVPGKQSPKGEPSGVSTGANCEDLVGARPVKRELDLEDLSVRVRLKPWRVAAVLYTQTRPPTANLRTARCASERAELRRSTQETARAWCWRTMSYARCSWSVAKPQ